MNIAYIIPGTGGTFYCQNCMRDLAIIHALRDLGHGVTAVPMYLPPQIGGEGIETDAPIFYGAVSLYLKHLMPFLRILPRFITRFLDVRFMLNYAARKSGTTKAQGLEEMTVSMLKGEEGAQSKELVRMVKWMVKQERVDCVHISNALLLGLVRTLKKELKVPVICSLQDEDQWIDCMEGSYPEKVWNLIRERSKDVDAFISVSRYYAETISNKLGIPSEKINTVYPGLEIEHYSESERPFDPPVIGYLARIALSQGLDNLLNAFILLKQDGSFKKLKLHISGGQTGDDVDFIKEIKERAVLNGIEKDIVFFDKFGSEDRNAFLQELTVLSVPAPGGESLGFFQLEAMAAGVPVVQPEAGAYPEIIGTAGGGIVFTPNTPEKLAETLKDILNDRERVKLLSKAGRTGVKKEFSIGSMAEQTVKVYETAVYSDKGER